MAPITKVQLMAVITKVQMMAQLMAVITMDRMLDAMYPTLSLKRRGTTTAKTITRTNAQLMAFCFVPL